MVWSCCWSCCWISREFATRKGWPATGDVPLWLAGPTAAVPFPLSWTARDGWQTGTGDIRLRIAGGGIPLVALLLAAEPFIPGIKFWFSCFGFERHWCSHWHSDGKNGTLDLKKITLCFMLIWFLILKQLLSTNTVLACLVNKHLLSVVRSYLFSNAEFRQTGILRA